MTRTKRLAAQASLLISILSLMGLGGAAGAWVGDRALGLSGDSSREVVAARRDEFPAFFLVALFGAMGGLLVGASTWERLARSVGLSDDEIREVLRKGPAAPDA